MITNHVVTERGTNVWTDLTSVQWWRQSGRCRCYWRAERRSPSRRERSASCVTRGWAFAACRRRSWSSRPHGGAGSRNRSLCWCYTPASWPYCSPGGSGNGTRDTTFNASYCLTFGFVSSTLGKVTTTPSIHPSITPSTNKTILESFSLSRPSDSGDHRLLNRGFSEAPWQNKVISPWPLGLFHVIPIGCLSSWPSFFLLKSLPLLFPLTNPSHMFFFIVQSLWQIKNTSPSWKQNKTFLWAAVTIAGRDWLGSQSGWFCDAPVPTTFINSNYQLMGVFSSLDRCSCGWFAVIRRCGTHWCTPPVWHSQGSEWEACWEGGGEVRWWKYERRFESENDVWKKDPEWGKDRRGQSRKG